MERVRNGPWMDGDPDRDYSAGLAAFGAAEIVLGALCFMLAAMLFGSVSAAAPGSLLPKHGVPSGIALLLLSAWWSAMGFGSLRARRWARALVIVGAWVAVFYGTLAMALALVVLPEACNAIVDAGVVGPGDAVAVLYAAVGMLFLLHMVFPLAAIVFYGMKGVRNSCERRNPRPCWTDRLPLPLMAMGCISILGSLLVVAGGFENHVVFFFGRVLSGGWGACVLLAVSAGSAYVGWGAFTRRMHAWWGAYVLVLLVCSSMMLTFAEIDMETLYLRMGHGAGDVDRLERFIPFSPAALTFVSCIWGILACIFLVWVRDCFRPAVPAEAVKSYALRKAEEAAAEHQDRPKVRMRLDH